MLSIRQGICGKQMMLGEGDDVKAVPENACESKSLCF